MFEFGGRNENIKKEIDIGNIIKRNLRVKENLYE